MIENVLVIQHNQNYQNALSIIFFMPAFLKSPNFFWWSKWIKNYLHGIDSRRRDWFRREKYKQPVKDSNSNKFYPKDAQSQYLKKQQDGPYNCTDDLARPEESVVCNIRIS